MYSLDILQQSGKGVQVKEEVKEKELADWTFCL